MDNTAPHSKHTIQALWRLEKLILDSLDFNDVVQKIVDSVLLELGYLNLGYRIVVLALVDEKTQTLKRISVSQTEEAKKALSILPIPFHSIDIPLSAIDNVCVKTLSENKPITTQDWSNLLCPPFSPEDAKKVQVAIGIKNSMIFPVISHNKAIGVIIFSMTKEQSQVSEDEMDLIKSFTDIVGLAVQNSSLYSSLEKASNELKDANERLKEIDKLKDEFVSLASHELRTPMTAIKSYVWLLLHGNVGQLTARQSLYLSRTYSSTERLINMVNDLLNTSRIESGRFSIEPSETDMGQLIDEVVIEVKARADEMHVGLAYKKPDVALVANIDANKIKEVLINLIGNSIKFTPENGSIVVTVGQDTSGNIVTSVADNGRGINPAKIPHLFQKFHMLGGGEKLTKEKGQGTGLGLYISRSIIELHGGKIWAQSEGEGKGSIFTFTLPINLNQQVSSGPGVANSQGMNLPSQPNPQA